MSVEREGSVTTFTCDGPACHKNYDGDEGFVYTWNEAKAHGWVNAEHLGEWSHFCPSCKKQLGD